MVLAVRVQLRLIDHARHASSLAEVWVVQIDLVIFSAVRILCSISIAELDRKFGRSS